MKSRFEIAMRTKNFVKNVLYLTLLGGCSLNSTSQIPSETPNPVVTPQQSIKTPTPNPQASAYQYSLDLAEMGNATTKFATSKEDYKLADTQFREAIKWAKSISPNNPNYSTAQKNIKEYQKMISSLENKSKKISLDSHKPSLNNSSNFSDKNLNSNIDQNNQKQFIVNQERENPRNPKVIKKRFLIQINTDMKLMKPLLDKSEKSDGVLRIYKRNKNYEYDIEKTNSIISPYIGNVVWNFVLKAKMDTKENSTIYNYQMQGLYAYQDNKWIMKSIEPTDPDWKNTDFHNKLKSIFLDLH
jgi:hypothetical protein